MRVKIVSIIFYCFLSLEGTSQSPPKLFLNCKSECYEDFLKQELVAFTFVRDRFLSDIEILVIEQESASNGKLFTLELIGREPKFGTKSRTASFHTNAGDSQDMVREKLLKNIKLGLFKLLMDSV